MGAEFVCQHMPLPDQRSLSLPVAANFQTNKYKTYIPF
jgi:hypothetical protein